MHTPLIMHLPKGLDARGDITELVQNIDSVSYTHLLQELLPNGYQFVAGRDYLLPIPPSELKLNRQMKQKPGWGEE